MIEQRVLGRTGLEVGRLGVAAGYGVPGAAVEEAFEEGVNYLYWGSRRTAEFASALRNLKSRRDRVVLVLQSYTRVAGLLGWSVERALRAIGYDHVDVLLLGLWNRPVPGRILDACRHLRDRGLVRFLAQSTHHRPLVPKLAGESPVDVCHVRYNALHPGAEREVFPRLPVSGRAGIVAFTATSWGQLPRGRRLPGGERVPTAGECYRFVLSEPAVDVCMCGPSSAAHMREALEAARCGPLDAADLEWMRRLAPAGKR